MANNMMEDRFSYRIIFFINDENRSKKYYIDTRYRDLRKSLESIIKNHLSLTNTIVIAETTVLKGGKCVYLQSRSYSFTLEEYFKQINGGHKSGNRNESIMYGKYAVR